MFFISNLVILGEWTVDNCVILIFLNTILVLFYLLKNAVLKYFLNISDEIFEILLQLRVKLI